MHHDTNLTPIARGSLSLPTMHDDAHIECAGKTRKTEKRMRSSAKKKEDGQSRPPPPFFLLSDSHLPQLAPTRESKLPKSSPADEKSHQQREERLCERERERRCPPKATHEDGGQWRHL